MADNFENKGAGTSEHPMNPSMIEDIDIAMYDWMDKRMNLYATTNKGWKKVPVIWVNGERAYQVKHNKDLRDSKGAFILPAITIERTAMNKGLASKGSVWSHVPGDDKNAAFEISRRIEQEKTSNFAAADTKRSFGQLHFPRKNKKIVYETAKVPLPTYVDVMYSIDIKTEYQEQMNQLVQPFMSFTGAINHFNIKSRNGYSYESFLEESYDMDNNVSDLQEEERLFHTTFQVKVLGYLIGEGENQTAPKVSISQNFVEVKIPRERVIVGDYDDLTGKKIF